MRNRTQGKNAALVLDRFHDVHAVRHGPEDDVLPVEPVVHVQVDKKLRRVRVPSSIRHRQYTSPDVLQREVLVREGLAVDRQTVRARPVDNVAALADEPRDHAVEHGTLERQLLAIRVPLLARAQTPKVLRGPRDDVGPQTHDDAAHLLAAYTNIEEDPRVQLRVAAVVGHGFVCGAAASTACWWVAICWAAHRERARCWTGLRKRLLRGRCRCRQPVRLLYGRAALAKR